MSGRSLALILAVAALALAAGLLAGRALKPDAGGAAPAGLERATVLGDQARPLPAFSLVDHEGRTVDAGRLTGRWSLLFFGYTHCPDVCPVTLAALKEALAGLDVEPPGGPAPVDVYFVSVDPERDTLERLGQYVTYFDPDFRGVTGPDAELQKLTRPLGILYFRPEEEAGGDYLVDHSASVLLVNPEGRLHAVLSAPHEAPVMARDLERILAAWKDA